MASFRNCPVFLVFNMADRSIRFGDSRGAGSHAGMVIRGMVMGEERLEYLVYQQGRKVVHVCFHGQHLADE